MFGNAREGTTRTCSNIAVHNMENMKFNVKEMNNMVLMKKNQFEPGRVNTPCPPITH
jgi:hypothetical protein